MMREDALGVVRGRRSRVPLAIRKKGLVFCIGLGVQNNSACFSWDTRCPPSLDSNQGNFRFFLPPQVCLDQHELIAFPKGVGIKVNYRG